MIMISAARAGNGLAVISERCPYHTHQGTKERLRLKGTSKNSRDRAGSEYEYWKCDFVEWLELPTLREPTS